MAKFEEAKSPIDVLVMFMRSPKEAFNDAIKSNRLSANPKDPNYAGNYMYMGPGKGGDAFKHKITREYID